MSDMKTFKDLDFKCMPTFNRECAKILFDNDYELDILQITPVGEKPEKYTINIFKDGRRDYTMLDFFSIHGSYEKPEVDIFMQKIQKLPLVEDRRLVVNVYCEVFNKNEIIDCYENCRAIVLDDKSLHIEDNFGNTVAIYASGNWLKYVKKTSLGYVQSLED